MPTGAEAFFVYPGEGKKQQSDKFSFKKQNWNTKGNFYIKSIISLVKKLKKLVFELFCV